MDASPIFDGLVCLFYVDPHRSHGERTKAKLLSDSEKYGARIVTRFCKSVTHIVLVLDKGPTTEFENPIERFPKLKERVSEVCSLLINGSIALLAKNW